MVQVDIKNLGADVIGIVHRARDEGTPLEILDHGEVVAHLLPVQRVSDAERARRWQALDELVEEIGKRTSGEVSAVEMIRDVRREL